MNTQPKTCATCTSFYQGSCLNLVNPANGGPRPVTFVCDQHEPAVSMEAYEVIALAFWLHYGPGQRTPAQQQLAEQIVEQVTAAARDAGYPHSDTATAMLEGAALAGKLQHRDLGLVQDLVRYAGADRVHEILTAAGCGSTTFTGRSKP
jgi:hypothetical protein